MSSRPPSIADLHRDPAEVATRLPAWRRGDVAEAVAETLAISARDTFGKAYTAWVWTGATPEGDPAWILPIPSSNTEAFAPRGPMGILTRSLRAAVESGASASAIRLLDWEGYTAVDPAGQRAAPRPGRARRMPPGAGARGARDAPGVGAGGRPSARARADLGSAREAGS